MDAPSGGRCQVQLVPDVAGRPEDELGVHARREQPPQEHVRGCIVHREHDLEALRRALRLARQ